MAPNAPTSAPRGSRRILVCDGEQRSALAVVRSLGKQGHEIAVCSHEARSLAGVSRWTRERFDVPDPLSDASGFATALREVALQWKPDVILPVTDQSNLALLAMRAEFAPAVIPGPTLDAFERVADKGAVSSFAQTHGIQVPNQIVLNVRDPDASVLKDIAYPVVLKPARSIADKTRHSVSYAANAAELRTRILNTPEVAFPLLLQQRVVGPGIGVFIFIVDGKVIATFSHMRVREAPPSGGVSVYCRSISAPKALVDRSAALLLSFGWEGAAMVEYKQDAATGAYHLMEINGRLWGSLQLAIDAGVDFPVLIVNATCGDVPATPPVFRVDVRLRSLWGDVASLATRLRYSRRALALPPDAPGRISALVDFFRWSPGEHSEIFRWNDLAPFRVETARFFLKRFHLSR